MARIVDFFDGAQSETTPTIGNIIASGIITYPDDATYEASEQNAPQEGNIYFNTTTKFLRYYNGTGWIDLVDDESVQTLINKSLDADLNTITNIDNDEIKALAGIDVTKLHDGSVDNTEFGYLDGVTSSIQDQLDDKQDLAEKGQPNGYASLDGSGLVPSSQLPSFVDDVLEFADFASFPVTGETGKLYVALDTNFVYRWSGTMYIQVSNGVNELSDLTDVDTTGVVDGQALIYNSSAMEWQPGTVQNVIQENVAFIGKGTAAWTQAPVGTVEVASNLTETNDFALSPGVEAGFTFTPSANGNFVNVVARMVDRGLLNKDGIVKARIYATTAGAPTGAALAVDAGNFSTAVNFPVLDAIVEQNFNFTPGTNLTAGTTYFISFLSSDTGTLYLRRGNVNETSSENYTENGAPPPDWNLSPVQETIWHRVNVNNVPASLVLDEDCFVSVPPLPNDYHTIEAQTIYLDNGQCAYVEIDRSAAAPTVLPVTVDDIDNVTPDNDIIVFARAEADECYLGIHDPQRISDGETPQIQKGGGSTLFGFEQNTIETKVLSANRTTNGAMPDLTCTLEVGKTYTVTGQISLILDDGSNDAQVFVNAVHDGSTIARARVLVQEAADSLTDLISFGISFSFVATTTSLTFEAQDASALSYVAGDNTRANTFIQIEQRNDLDPANAISNSELNVQTVHVRYKAGALAQGPAAATVLYNIFEYDNFNSYNPGTGVFTAPRTGYYRIKAQVAANAGGVNANQNLLVVKNTVTQATSDTLIESPGTTTCESDVTLFLLENDQIIISSANSQSQSTIADSNRNFVEIHSLPDLSIYGVINPDTSNIQSSGVGIVFPHAADTWGDISSISLSEGTWDIKAQASYFSAAATTSGTVFLGAGPTAGAVSPGTFGEAFIGQNKNNTSGAYDSITFFRDNVVVVSPTTYYLKSFITVSVANIQVSYNISARKVK